MVLETANYSANGPAPMLTSVGSGAGGVTSMGSGAGGVKSMGGGTEGIHRWVVELEV